MKTMERRLLLPFALPACLVCMHALVTSGSMAWTAALAAGLVLACGAVYVIFRHMVSRRLEAMANYVQGWTDRPDRPEMAPMAVGGDDAIGVLARSINDLLESLSRDRTSFEKRVEHTAEPRALNEHLTSELAERQNSGDAMLERDRIHRLILDNSTDMITCHMPDSTIIYATPSCERLLGYRPDDMVGRKAGDFVVPDDMDDVWAAVRKAQDAGEDRYRAEFRMVRNDGTIMWAETLGRFIRDENGRVVEIHSTVRDITERKRTEAALKETEERYRSLFENAIEGIFQTTLDGRLIMINTSLAHMLGYDSPQDAKDRVIDIGSQVYADPRERRSLVDRLMREGKVMGSEVLFRRVDRTLMKVMLNFRLVRDHEGNPLRIEGSCIDITKRWKAEEAMSASEAKYRRLYESMRDGFVMVDMKGAIIEYNKVFADMIGYEENEVRGLTFRDITPEKWRVLEDKIIEKETLVRGYSDIYEKEYRRKDGTVFPVDLRSYLLRDDMGVPSGMWAIIRDITDRKKAEERLRDANRRLENIIEFLPDATFITDGDGRIVAWNRAIEEMTGIPKVEILGMDHRDAMVSFYGEPGACLVDFIGKDEREILPRYRDIRRKGDTLYAEVSTPALYGGRGAHIWAFASPLYDSEGYVIGAIESIRDITEWKHAEEELRESEARYRLLAENASDIIFTLDTDLRFTYISPSVQRIRGYTVKEAMAQSPEDILPPASLKIATKALREEMEIEAGDTREPHRSRTLELETRCKDGATIWTETTFTTLRDAKDRLVGFLGITRDITERKRAADERSRLEAQLAQAQKMESIGTLAGGIAHDFNNILSAIIGYTELAVDDLSDPEKVKRELREVLRAGERARDLVSQILTFSRKTETVCSPLALRTVVKESLKMLRSLTPTTIDIRQNLVDSGLVMSNPTQIHQIVMNLCTNAAHAMGSKGGVLEVSLERVVVEKDTAGVLEVDPGPFLRLTVSDTGHGMPPEVMERVFEPYFTTKEMGCGTGLGLSVVHGIVKSHAGAIVCRSVQGEGSTFEVYLPELEPEDKPTSSSTREPVPTGTERILFVDDEPILVNLAEKMLTRLGYSVTAKTGSVEAFEAFRERPDEFDLVITDMTMPVMSGDMLARKIMAMRPDIPIILCTGYSEHITEELAQSMGIRQFLVKPIDMGGLARTLRKLLDEK